jgi:hypothetical protein
VKQKIEALFMITVMVLTAATFAVTAKPANAASTQAPVGSANVRGPALVGSALGAGTPAITYDGSGSNFFLFVRGTDGALWWMYRNDMTGWSSPTSLGGILTSDPAVLYASWGLYVGVRGSDGALWGNYYSFQDGSWTGWQYYGGHLLAGTGPSAGSWDTYTWFITGTDHAVWALNPCGGVWENLGGYVTSSPGAAAPTKTAIKVFVRGNDGALWSRSGTMDENCHGAWSSWQSLGGKIPAGAQPEACAYGSRFDVFVRGTDSAVWHRWYDGGWSGWESLGGYVPSSPAACTDPYGPLFIDAIVRGSDGALWQNDYYDGSWSGWMQYNIV